MFHNLLRFDCCVRTCACSLLATKLPSSGQYPTTDTGDACPCWRPCDGSLHGTGHLWVCEIPDWFAIVCSRHRQKQILQLAQVRRVQKYQRSSPKKGSLLQQVSTDRTVVLPAELRPSHRLKIPGARTMPSVPDLVVRAAKKWPTSNPTSELRGAGWGVSRRQAFKARREPPNSHQAACQEGVEGSCHHFAAGPFRHRDEISSTQNAKLCDKLASAKLNKQRDFSRPIGKSNIKSSRTYQWTSHHSGPSYHLARESCHTPRIGCQYSRDVRWTV